MAFDNPRIIIGHRGAAGLAPENTLGSFSLAADLGVAAVELDVHVCGTRLVVIHDEALERTTNGAGLVGECPLDALRRLNAGNGAQIPFLEEVFEALPPDIGINIELKGAGTAGPVAALLKAMRITADRDILISSFNHAELFEFRALDSETALAPLFNRWRDNTIEIAEQLGSRFINLHRKLITPARLASMESGGFRVLAYTVNQLSEAERLFTLGVAGVFTDFPDRITLGALTHQAPSPDGTSRR